MADEEYQLYDFEKAILGLDDLGAVVRGAIHVETKLLAFIALRVKDESYVRKLGLDFSKHVDLAVALGLNAEYAKGLRAFGKLRNDFAHKLDTVLSKERVNCLYEALSSREKELVQRSHELTDIPKPPFKKLPPKHQFVYIAVTLHAVLEEELKEPT